MEQLVINIKNKSKLSFVLQLFKQFDFIEVVNERKRNHKEEYDFYASAGLWKNRKIEAAELRKRAWKR